MHLLINSHRIFFGSRNTAALAATQCLYCLQYQVVLIYVSTNIKSSRNRDTDDDDCHDDNNNFKLCLQRVSQQLATNRLDPGFKCPSQIQTEELLRAGDGAAFLEQHVMWTLVQQQRSLIPICV